MGLLNNLTKVSLNKKHLAQLQDLNKKHWVEKGILNVYCLLYINFLVLLILVLLTAFGSHVLVKMVFFSDFVLTFLFVTDI